MAHKASTSLTAASEEWGHTAHGSPPSVSSSRNLLPGQVRCNRTSVPVSFTLTDLQEQHIVHLALHFETLGSYEKSEAPAQTEH